MASPPPGEVHRTNLSVVSMRQLERDHCDGQTTTIVCAENPLKRNPGVDVETSTAKIASVDSGSTVPNAQVTFSGQHVTVDAFSNGTQIGLY